uniref:Uncharacterized protein n=1 Tax=Candidatus Kentrum sp. LFY TaxID=2126342 RepID=A0A450V039_9GAMM|nr:MAG: hypothetical protein BECKLFY1418B_GA0070995_11143 [Candidatus Kentron sp. LFY]
MVKTLGNRDRWHRSKNRKTCCRFLLHLLKIIKGWTCGMPGYAPRCGRTSTILQSAADDRFPTRLKGNQKFGYGKEIRKYSAGRDIFRIVVPFATRRFANHELSLVWPLRGKVPSRHGALGSGGGDGAKVEGPR